MGRPIKKGSTDQSTVIRIIDSSDGTPENAVDYDTSGIDLWFRREKENKTSISEGALFALNSAHGDGGIELIGDGYYRLDLPDAAVAAGAGKNSVQIGGTVTGMIVIGNEHALVDYDPYDAVRAGLAALPNAAANAAGGLLISAGGALALDTILDANISTRAPASEYDTAMARITDNVATAANLATVAGYLDTEIAAMKAVIDNLPNSGSLNDLATIASRLTAARAGYLDELASANIPADVDTLKIYCDILDHATNGLANIKSLIDAVKAKTDSLNFTATNVHAHTKATDVGGDATLANQTAIKAVTDLINGLLEDSDGYRYTAKALEEAPSGAGLTGTQNTALILIRDIMEGDATIDITTTPWQLVIKKKGTSTEVVKKNLKDVNGVNIAAVTTVIGQQLEP